MSLLSPLLKRIFDLSFAITLLIMTGPLFLLLAIMIKNDSEGPVFYGHERMGLGGKPFMLLKFRSMVSNADKIGSYQTKRNDSRITKVGAWLRKTSLDELPQVFNILKGEMSVVGPRPDVLKQKELYSPEEWKLRCSVKPGLTGLAQAVVRSNATMRQRKCLDFFYVNHASFLFDCYIVWRTAKAVLKNKGAF